MQRKKAPVVREARAFKIPLEAKKGTGSNVSGCDRIGCSYSNPASDSLVATDQIPDEHPMCSTNSSTGGGPLVRGARLIREAAQIARALFHCDVARELRRADQWLCYFVNTARRAGP